MAMHCFAFCAENNANLKIICVCISHFANTQNAVFPTRKEEFPEKLFESISTCRNFCRRIFLTLLGIKTALLSQKPNIFTKMQTRKTSAHP